MLDREVKPTALRILIMRELLKSDSALSLTDMEISLDTVDKSTISRSLALFLKQKLIHSIDDGTGTTKYSICNTDCNCIVNDLHIHFHCYHCNKTFCLEGLSIPPISLPKNFTSQSANFVIKGLCNECNTCEN